MTRLLGRILCDWLHHHSGSIESYGGYSYIKCERCGELRQPMPKRLAEARFGAAE